MIRKFVDGKKEEFICDKLKIALKGNQKLLEEMKNLRADFEVRERNLRNTLYDQINGLKAEKQKESEAYKKENEALKIQISLLKKPSAQNFLTDQINQLKAEIRKESEAHRKENQALKNEISELKKPSAQDLKEFIKDLNAARKEKERYAEKNGLKSENDRKNSKKYQMLSKKVRDLKAKAQKEARSLGLGRLASKI